MPNSHGGRPNSASIGSTGASRSPSQRWRFHQPETSETQYRVPSGPHAGWSTEASPPVPPAIRRGDVRAPSAPTSASHSSVASHGMFGWFQQTQASRPPSRLRRGEA